MCIRDSMQPAEHTVIGDRIEAGTFLIAGAITGGDVEVHGVTPHHLDMFLSKLRAAGVQVKDDHRKIRAWGDPQYYTATDVATLPAVSRHPSPCSTADRPRHVSCGGRPSLERPRL